MKLLITESEDFSKQALNNLSEKFDIQLLPKLNSIEEFIEDVDILFIRLGLIFDQDILTKAKNLKYICSPTTGLDHIDEIYCHKNDIKIISLRGEYDFLESIPSTAEHTWCLLQAVNRNLINAHLSTSSKQWNRDDFKSFNLDKKTLGILGLGRVGKQIAKYGLAFNMKVIAYDTDQSKSFPEVKMLNSPKELFKKSDFISIHIPFTKSNFEYVNKDLLKKMKKKACIINTSRGKIWDESAVKKAIINDDIRGVATDVVYKEISENIFQSPLFEVDTSKYNCIITPHIAGATYDSMSMTELFITQKLLKNA